MHLVEFTCDGFRCLQDIRIEPAQDVTVIQGDNAQGKTSILEAILFTATSKSHRTTVEQELVRHNGDGFRLQAKLDNNGREVLVQANWWRGTKRFKVNGVALTRISDVLGKMGVVMFSPEDLVLVKGAASTRRRFLDMELSQVSPPYLNALQNYRQLLRQRNELLRVKHPDLDLLDIWDEQLAQHGAVLHRERAAFVEDLARHAVEAYTRIAEEEHLRVNYLPDIEDAGSMVAVFEKTRPTDLRRGMTTRGPHRDDIEIAVGDQPARNFGSQGQQKTAALALKLAEVAVVHERSGTPPILMLDEVLSELDDRRAERLFGAIGHEVQCVFTTTASMTSSRFPGRSCRCYTIRDGRLE